MLGGLLFIFWRIAELVTLIPIIGMLAWFVSNFQNSNQLTPDDILVLFIVSVLAAAWALMTLIRMGSTRRSAMFVAVVDLLFVGALIGGVVELRDIAGANCSHFNAGYFYANLNVNKDCAMRKASFVLGIMNIIFFIITFILALLLHRHQRGEVVREKVTRRRSHGSRRGHSSRRSHSSRRQYYV